MRRLPILVVLLALAGVGGGTALAASSAYTAAPAAPVHPTTTHSAQAFTAAPVELAHPKSKVVVVASTPKVVVTTPKPVATSRPTPVVPAATPRPTATPKPVVKSTPKPTPRPTPVPTPSGTITSGTLPPLTFTIDANGVTSTMVGDSLTKTITCPTADTNCISGMTFSVPEWGNYNLTLSWKFAFTTYVGGPSIVWTNQMDGGLSGSGCHSGTGGPIGYSSGGYYSISLTVEVAWA